MTVAELREKCKSLSARVPADVLIVSILVFAASLSFGLGYLAGRDAGQGSEITITAPLPAQAGGPSTGEFVASKSGTKYYLPDCPGVERISEGNKVWFATAAAARAEGYTPAANCPGL